MISENYLNRIYVVDKYVFDFVKATINDNFNYPSYLCISYLYKI